MIRKYKVFQRFASAKTQDGRPLTLINTIGIVEAETWFDARQKACAKYHLALEDFDVKEIPPEPVAPPVYDKNQRPPPALTPHLRKQKGPPCAHCQGTGRNPNHPSFRAVTFMTAANMCPKCQGTGVGTKKKARK